MSVTDGRKGELMNKKMISAVLSVCTLLSMTACATTVSAGAGAPEEAGNTEAEESGLKVSEDNLIPDVSLSAPGEPFKFDGKYYSDRCYISFEKGDGDKVNIKAGWGGSYNEATEWTMTGTYDSASYCIEYTDCVKKDVVYKDVNEVEKEDTLYSDGTGTFLFSISGDSVTWTDKKEDIANGKIFQLDKDSQAQEAKDPSADVKDMSAGDKDYYSGCSAMNKADLEDTADTIRRLYLAEDWEAMKKYIKFPVIINGALVDDEKTYDKVIKGKKVIAESRQAIEEENCHDMFYNGQGICLGSGQIWLNDYSYMTDKVPELRVKTIQGID